MSAFPDTVLAFLRNIGLGLNPDAQVALPQRSGAMATGAHLPNSPMSSPGFRTRVAQLTPKPNTIEEYAVYDTGLPNLRAI